MRTIQSFYFYIIRTSTSFDYDSYFSSSPHQYRHGYTGWVPNTQLIYFNHNFLGIPLTVYSIWNLNFLTLYRDPFCIPNICTTTGVILLQYVTAACPLLFIIVSYTWIYTAIIMATGLSVALLDQSIGYWFTSGVNLKYNHR